MRSSRLKNGLVIKISLLILTIAILLVSGALFVRYNNLRNANNSSDNKILIEGESAGKDERAIKARQALADRLKAPIDMVKIIKISQDAPVSYSCATSAVHGCDSPTAVTMSYDGESYYAVIRYGGTFDLWAKDYKFLE